MHEYPDVEQVKPGDTVPAFLCFLAPESHVGKVTPGMAFLIREGRKIVGYGSVIRVLDLEGVHAPKR